MTFLDVLGHFLAVRFPFWGCCRLSFQPDTRALHVHCKSLAGRIAVIQDRRALMSLDIGLESVVVILDNYPDFVIDLVCAQ